MIKLSKLIWFLILFAIIIDILNGFVLRYTSISISLFYKSIILILLFYSNLRLKLKKNIFYTSLLIVPIIFHTILLNFHIVELQWFSRILTAVLLFYFLNTYNNYLYTETFFKIIFIVLILSSLLWFFFDIGFDQYANNEVGTRGFFIAGNELGVLHILTSAYFLRKLFFKKMFIKYMFFSVVSILISITFATKVSLIGIFLLIVLIPISNFLSSKINLRKIKKSSILFFTILSVILIIIIPYSIDYVLNEIGLINRINYFIDRIDLITLIFSGRNILLMDFINSNLFYSNILFGPGYIQTINELGNSIEMDLPDFYAYFGLIGVFIYFKYFYILFKSIYENSSSFYVNFSVLILLFFISNTAGHVVTSGLSMFSLIIFFKCDEKF